MDDLLLIAETYNKAKTQSDSIKKCLTQLGFIISTKSMSVPATVVQFLGLMVDSRHMTVGLPPDKVERLVQMATTFQGNIN